MPHVPHARTVRLKSRRSSANNAVALRYKLHPADTLQHRAVVVFATGVRVFAGFHSNVQAPWDNRAKLSGSAAFGVYSQPFPGP